MKKDFSTTRYQTVLNYTWFLSLILIVLLYLIGFQGADCSEVFDVCAQVNPCNNGECTNVIIGSDEEGTSQSYFTCTCLPGWEGRRCDSNVNECERIEPCANGGSCTDNDGSYICSCNNDWTGNVITIYLIKILFEYFAFGIFCLVLIPFQPSIIII